MTMFLDTFHVPDPHSSLQIIHYDGPPKPKQPSQRTPSKTVINEDRARNNAERENKDITPTLNGIELNDFTFFVEERVCELSGIRDGGNGDVGTADGSSLKTTSRGTTPSSREDGEDEASHQPTLSVSGSQGDHRRRQSFRPRGRPVQQ